MHGVRALRRNLDAWQGNRLAQPGQASIALFAFALLMGFIVELNSCNDRQIVFCTEDEIEVLLWSNLDGSSIGGKFTN
ncbi:hypothetical protein ABO04_06335 [Nitrosomonas sp. HPC101]|uniref:hypothetical protein n=1 Tax=Nitrosomonas sp. HPC101 TaxID=1658667 RepID=UPI001F03A7E7|nr:hypothetical protein [Nitrosomonas sp. HPC101]MXS85534.1 hypothetical protein [Nitrosomonas sp. HPC101]